LLDGLGDGRVGDLDPETIEDYIAERLKTPSAKR